MMLSNKFVELELTYHYPGGDTEEVDGEDVDIYDSGGYGKAIIYLNDSSIFIVTDDSDNSSVSYYIEEGVISVLGTGPLTIDDIKDDGVEEAMSNLYVDDCRTSGAFVTLSVSYVDWDDEYEVVENSEKLQGLAIPRFSVLRLLRVMEKNGII